MKIKIEPPIEKCTRKYPYIGIHRSDITRPDPLIVYFTADGVGIPLCVNDGCLKPTQSRSNWDEESFEWYRGKIILQND